MGAPPAGLLDGLTVISLAQQYPGPYCTMLLADLGADVVLVERPNGGDPARGIGGMSPFFASLNRNKRSVALDLSAEEGKQVLWDLLEKADVLVEGFRPGVMERLGFGAASVRARFRSLVYVSISGYGQDGPDKLVAGHDLSYAGRAGVLAASVEAGSTEEHLPLAIADLSSGTFAAFAIVAGVTHRHGTGEGAYIDLSMTEGLVSWMGITLEPHLNSAEADLLRTGREPAYGIYRCGDGKLLSLSIAFEDHFWQRLCDTFDLGQWRALGSPERRQKAEALRELIASRLESDTRDRWIAALTAADVPCGAVSSLAEVTEDAQFRARGMFQEGPGESGGSRWHVGFPFLIEGSRPPIRLPAPQLGEHTHDVLGRLGYDAGRLAALQAAGVIN